MATGTRRPVPDVAVFGLQRRAGERHQRPWIVRWAVCRRQRSRSFLTRAEADRHRAALLLVVQRGEPFDEANGEPATWQPLPTTSVRTTGRAGGWPSSGRSGLFVHGALTRRLPLLVDPSALPPPTLRRHLTATLSPAPGAGGDQAHRIAWFHDAGRAAGVDVAHLALFPMPNTADPAGMAGEADLVWVGGGSVANLLAVWRLHGLDGIFADLWRRGVVLGGVSAGSICWHVGGTTDSFGTELRAVTGGLGLLPYSNGVHYDSEEQRRPLFQRFVGSGAISDGYATDDGVGLVYRGRSWPTRSARCLARPPTGWSAQAGPPSRSA